MICHRLLQEQDAEEEEQEVAQEVIAGEDRMKLNLSDISYAQIEDAIDHYIIGRNAERDRKILKRRLLDGICYEPLAEEFDLSVRQIKNIVYKREHIIFKHI